MKTANMRSLITLVEGIVETNPIAAELSQISQSKRMLPAGTKLYHGTTRPVSEWNPARTPIATPAWFGLDPRIAKEYASYARGGLGGEPYVIEYRLTSSVNLLDVSEGDISELFDQFYDEWTTDEIAMSVVGMGYDGWYIEGSEVMLGYEDNIVFVEAKKINHK